MVDGRDRESQEFRAEQRAVDGEVVAPFRERRLAIERNRKQDSGRGQRMEGRNEGTSIGAGLLVQQGFGLSGPVSQVDRVLQRRFADRVLRRRLAE